jgi:hypothetical protein
MANPEAPYTTEEKLRALMLGITKILPNHAITLLVGPVGVVPDPRVNYISNVHRSEMMVMMKEVVGRLEGRAHDAPATRQ